MQNRLKITNYLKSVSISVVAVLATVLPLEAAAKELSMAAFFTRNGVYHDSIFAPFAEKVAELSGGQLTVKIFLGGALNSNPRAQYSVVTQGIADMAFGLPGYTSDLFPISNTISMPGYVENAVDGTEKLWNAISLVESEYDAKLLAVWASGEAILITRDTQISRLEDLAGLKLRVASGADAQFVKALGASPVSQPVTVLNQNLSSGIIDGIFIGAGGIPPFKLWESGKYIATGIPMSPAVFFFIMNQNVYDSLSAQEQSWIDQASGYQMSLDAAEVTAMSSERGLAISKSNGTIVNQMSEQEILRMKGAIAGSINAFLAEEINSKLLRKDVIEAMDGD